MMTSLSYDAMIVLLSVGVLLIYLEMNRPGCVLPGAVGLCLVLFVAHGLARQGVSGFALAALTTATGLLLLLVLPLPPTVPKVPFEIGAPLFLIAGFWLFDPSPRHPWLHLEIAFGCGSGLGLGSVCLSRIATRARTNKRRFACNRV